MTSNKSHLSLFCFLAGCNVFVFELYPSFILVNLLLIGVQILCYVASKFYCGGAVSHVDSYYFKEIFRVTYMHVTDKQVI